MLRDSFLLLVQQYLKLHPLSPLNVDCLWRVCLAIVYPLMEADSCVHNMMGFKWDVNGGTMAGVVLAHGVLLSRRKTPQLAVQQGRGSDVIYRRQDESSCPLNGCLLWMTTKPHFWGRLTSGLRPLISWINFAPCWQISNMPTFFHPSRHSRAHKKRGSIFFIPIQAKVQILTSLRHAFVCPPPPSFGLFTATFPTTTVDKFNVPELVVQAQEGFWSATVDVYHRGYQLMGKKENNTQICVITVSQSGIRMCGQMFIRAGWHQRPTSCCSHLLRRELGAERLRQSCSLRVLHTEGARAAADPGGGGIHMHHVLKSCAEEKSLPWPGPSNDLWIHARPSGTRLQREYTCSFDLWPYLWFGLMRD